MNENKDLVYIPEEDVTVSFEVTANKPFNKCFECRSFRNGCSGPNLPVMGIARAAEFLQSARIFLGQTYQQVADGSKVSVATVKRILTGKISNPDYFSMSAIIVHLLGDPNGKYPCAIPNTIEDIDKEAKLNEALRDLERALDDNKDYRTALDNIHTSYNAEMQIIRDEAQKKIDFLIEQLEHYRMENNYLWAENNRKSKVVDTFLEKQNVYLGEKKEQN